MNLYEFALFRTNIVHKFVHDICETFFHEFVHEFMREYYISEERIQRKKYQYH